MKNIAILGSTGSIGESALNVAREFRSKFRVVALSTNANCEKLYSQVREFNPLFVSVKDKVQAAILKKKISPRIRVYSGSDGASEIVKAKEIDHVLMAISGSGALLPLLAAIESKKQIALANKEALVMAGVLVMNAAARKKVKIIPIDSEQSAIWQCLEASDKSGLKMIYLTASGGPFRDMPKSGFNTVSLKDVLRHPRWRMGRKITVDSATLMNKGLELLEAMHLFGVACDKIRILIHPEAIIHSMVEYVDGAVIAQLSQTDMRIPIQYALTYPERLKNRITGLDFAKLKSLNFEAPDFNKFPSLGLAYEAAKVLGTMPAVMNAANEVAAEEFLMHKIKFNDIPRVTEKVMRLHRVEHSPGLNRILGADNWARLQAHSEIDRLS
jgi:1-deoxy-D-xylulose-5-phosphate reductoisomerase